MKRNGHNKKRPASFRGIVIFAVVAWFAVIAIIALIIALSRPSIAQIHFMTGYRVLEDGQIEIVEYFLVRNAPTDADALYELLKRFDERNPIAGIPSDLPEHGIVMGYSRRFYHESGGLLWGVNRHNVRLSHFETGIFSSNGISPGFVGQVSLNQHERGVSSMARQQFDGRHGQRGGTYENTDPTINGLFCLLPEHMIPEEAKIALYGE